MLVRGRRIIWRNLAWNLLVLGALIALWRFVFFPDDTWGELAVDGLLGGVCAAISFVIVSRIAARSERRRA
jgi:hypothetical protein